ncbi:hypothetical protein JK359_01785 [Streptomyces actinomycinicus]|uniref:Secreted protein n=1 Tax=Streptomyces actinomycinicus TaxID=1695166 RepID=A0A937EEH3_9ACTN|nr:hypothetical protein [Streptomyces actinomycinicus]MBL1080716.1 hypothetical protein [Streptomyces actinomycinicus]
MKRRSRFGSTIIFAFAALARAACADDAQGHALSLAREACAVKYRASTGDPLADSTARQAARNKTLPSLEEAADKAAQAARLDDTWQPLATTLNRFAELASVTIELGDLRDTRVGEGYATPEDVDRDNQLDARRTGLIRELDSSSLTGECRKAKDSS